MIAALASIRAHAPLLTFAYALVWANALEQQGEGLLGLLVAGAHTTLVWLWFVTSARVEALAGLGSRLGLSREPDGAPVEPLAWTGIFLAMVFGALCLALLAASWRVGLGFLAAGGVLHWHARSAAMATRYRGLEVLGPAAVLALPGLIISANLQDDSSATGARLAGISALAAVSLGAFVIAALTRDGLRDADRGVPTVATRMGSSAAGALGWVWMLSAMTLAMIGAGWGWWHWSAGVIAGLGASGAGWALARGNAGSATVVWYAAAVALSIAVGVSVIAPA